MARKWRPFWLEETGGTLSRNAKLSDDEVRTIFLARGVKTSKVLAAEYGVHHSTVCKIWRREAYRRETEGLATHGRLHGQTDGSA